MSNGGADRDINDISLPGSHNYFQDMISVTSSATCLQNSDKNALTYKHRYTVELLQKPVSKAAYTNDQHSFIQAESVKVATTDMNRQLYRSSYSSGPDCVINS